MKVYTSLNKYFEEKLQDLDCPDLTKSYIVSIFVRYKSANEDLSTKSLTLEYVDAKNTRNFQKFQNIGDWVFFSSSYFPESIPVSKEYYYSLGQLSYYSCFKIVKNWNIYEQLADRLVDLTTNSRKFLFG